MIINFEGQRIQVPDDATDAEIEEVLNSISPAKPAAPADVRDASGVPGGTAGAPEPEPSIVDTIMGALGYAGNTGAVGLNGARRGMAEFAALPGLAVDAANNAPRLLNLLPGVDNVGPMTDHPFLGSQMLADNFDAALRAPAELGAAAYNKAAEAVGSDSRAQADRQPEDAFQRIVHRVGREVGATAVPVGGAIGVASRVGVDGARQLGPLGRFFVEPAAVAPESVIAKEATYATGSGMGAGIANEAAGNSQDGDNFWSDFLGSLAGVGITGLASKVIGTGRNVLGAVTGKPNYMDDVAGEQVVNQIIDNSSSLADQYARTGQVDTRPLARQLRTPSAAEDAIPGYVSNIGDRSGDPALMTHAQNVDMVSPGAANMRRTANNQAIDARMAELAPNGDPAAFRSSLEANRDSTIARAAEEEDLARAIFGDANQAIEPTMPNASARGSSLRAGLQDAKDTLRSAVDESWDPINNATTKVDVGPLRDRFAQVDETLPLNDRQRFRPTEANVPQQLAPAANDAPVATGLLDASGNPIMRDAKPVQAEVPLREVTSARSGLSDDMRAQRANGQNQAARVGQKYVDEIDSFVENAIPTELRQQYDAARAARRDMADRFERPGTAIAETLRKREGGGYQMNDNTVSGRFVQPDGGRLDDMNAVLREAGDDPRVRTAMADEILAQVQKNGLADRPDALERWMTERRSLLDNFPELRDRLGKVREARSAVSAAEFGRRETEKRLTVPGRSAQATYLKYGDEATVDAINAVTSGPKPREAARELLAAAGDTPEARLNARSALWESVKTKKFSAPDAKGAERWDAKRLKAMFDDPKVSAVADELWADNPQDLADIKEVFGALAGAEGSVRTRAAGSSGTAQALANKFDPSMTASSIASRVRSVHRGQLSPGIAVVDLAATYLRNRSAKVQARAIDTLSSAVVNNPGLAADLLERYNPADWAARRRMIAQKYGVRATQILNLLDEAHGQDETRDAIVGDEPAQSRLLDIVGLIFPRNIDINNRPKGM
ncbi:hypothetical protein M2281_001623 [Mesorhizobium soli]|uniref:hypothetical protein n=1 Tax=Pseudaminobacter soli (ex Li et al. 2025) TaxID=1295366 RepID=UPI0024730455|nr:hypothetical protein [Mesorhizobium soli]MDH6231051.1 hypothetical protein [Mesorhizobium soli]